MQSSQPTNAAVMLHRHSHTRGGRRGGRSENDQDERQRRIDHARTGAVGTGDLRLDRLDDLVAVPRLFGDEVQDDEPKIALSEKTAESETAAAKFVATMPESLSW
jgi:hypothetical protein